MGLNPFRDQRTSALDIGLVVFFVVITAILIGWGFFG
jgi:hypothetical protein